jgi:hypothetical protein
MKVRMTLDISEAERYLIATYFRDHGEVAQRGRMRATRAQVKRYIEAALKLALRERRDGANGRTRTIAARIALGAVLDAGERIERPAERTGNLFT